MGDLFGLLVQSGPLSRVPSLSLTQESLTPAGRVRALRMAFNRHKCALCDVAIPRGPGECGWDAYVAAAPVDGDGRPILAITFPGVRRGLHEITIHGVTRTRDDVEAWWGDFIAAATPDKQAALAEHGWKGLRFHYDHFDAHEICRSDNIAAVVGAHDPTAPDAQFEPLRVGARVRETRATGEGKWMLVFGSIPTLQRHGVQEAFAAAAAARPSAPGSTVPPAHLGQTPMPSPDSRKRAREGSAGPETRERVVTGLERTAVEHAGHLRTVISAMTASLDAHARHNDEQALTPSQAWRRSGGEATL